jgi:cytochrome c556
MKRLFVAAALALAATAVIAQGSDPIAARQALMKAQGAQAVVGVRMVRERDPFEPAKAEAVYAAFLDTTRKFGTLFPDSSKTGDTKASAKIWEDRKGFEAALAKFTQDVTANKDKIKTLDEFRAGFNAVAQNCQNCHEVYRQP